MRFLPFVGLVLSALASASAQAAALRVAAASDLSFCLGKINTRFEQTAPDTVIQVSFGSSGQFVTQIENGAPYDVFLSADKRYAEILTQKRLAPADTLTVYAFGKIALWTLKPSIDLSRGLAVLDDPAIKHIAIANPAHAPYGQAARAALGSRWQSLSPKLVLGDNIAQTAQFVESGNADIGIVAYSLLVSPQLAGKGRYALIEPRWYPKLEQSAVVIERENAHPLARRYVSFLRTPETRRLLQQCGFGVPD